MSNRVLAIVALADFVLMVLGIVHANSLAFFVPLISYIVAAEKLRARSRVGEGE